MDLKRVLGAVLSGAMVLPLAACGGGGDAETTSGIQGRRDLQGGCKGN